MCIDTYESLPLSAVHDLYGSSVCVRGSVCCVCVYIYTRVCVHINKICTFSTFQRYT